jgi:biopolymer transport protein TolR
MAMSAGGGKEVGTLSEINVTPLVDVMLVLLIVFMVTAPIMQTGVDVDLPDAKAQTVPDESGKLIVTMTKERKVYIGRMEIPFEEVETKLRANAKLQVDHEAYLHADTNLSYGDVVKVMAAIKLAGGDKMGLITDPLE